MAIKKKNFNENEVIIFDNAVIYKRGEYWQFRFWLAKESKYVRRSLKTTKLMVAKEKAKEMYLEIYAGEQQGKKYFSMTAKEGVEAYLKERYKDVESGLIVVLRHKVLSQQLKHFLRIVGENKKTKELKRSDLEYYYNLRLQSSNNKVTLGTIKNEQATINSMMRFLHKQGEAEITGFDFKKLPKIDTSSEDVRRSTLTNEEYNQLVIAMRSYTAKTTKLNKKLTEKELLIRKIVQHYILIAANSGLRVGEQLKLKWGDIRVEEHTGNTDEKVKLARIHVRAETSKVRKSRTFLCRNGQYFERLKGVFSERNEDDYIFSIDGKQQMLSGTIAQHFKRLLELAEVKRYKERGIVLYSLRHFMITQRVMSGLSLRQVADMCGTSVAMIEKTYWHLNDEMRKTAAMADFRRRDDGTIEII
jgi:integrase